MQFGANDAEVLRAAAAYAQRSSEQERGSGRELQRVGSRAGLVHFARPQSFAHASSLTFPPRIGIYRMSCLCLSWVGAWLHQFAAEWHELPLWPKASQVNVRAAAEEGKKDRWFEGDLHMPVNVVACETWYSWIWGSFWAVWRTLMFGNLRSNMTSRCQPPSTHWKYIEYWKEMR